MCAVRSSGRPSVVRFGVFEADRKTGELRKHGSKVRLSGQPFEILTLLLERPGEVVTREELRAKLWPDNTFVDFDHSVHAAINKLREALGDSAEQPSYVETLPRRGYRFIGTVNNSEAVKAATKKETAEGDARKRWLSWAAALALFAALIATISIFYLRRMREHVGNSTAPPFQSLAVLPLTNLSGDPEQEYFSDGMTDALITDLAQIDSLKVISRTSTMKYKKTDKPLPQIARELHVWGIIEGTVQRSGERVRITARLIEGATDRHLWAQSYERDMRDVLALQSDVAHGITDEIRIKLFPKNPTHTVNPEAYEAYLLGRYIFNSATSEADIDRSISRFEFARAKDPQSSLPFAGLAISYVALSDYYQPPREVMPKAKQAAKKALELEETLSEAHDALGWVEFAYDWDWPAAERDLRRALELNPGNALAHDHYANYLSSSSHHPEAFAEARRALEIDPLSLAVQADSGFYSYMGREYDRAIDLERSALRLDPNCNTCRAYLALAYVQKGQLAEALSEARRVKLSSASPLDVATAGSVIAAAGERTEAESLLRDLRAVMKKRFVCPYEIATTYLALGQQDQAIRQLKNAYEAHSICMIWLKVDPRLDTLRSDPRFAELVHLVGTPP